MSAESATTALSTGGRLVKKLHREINSKHPHVVLI